MNTIDPRTTVTATATRSDDPGRWVRLTLGLRDATDELPFLAHASTFLGAVEPLDPLAEEYTLENWESGLLSGVGYYVRRSPPFRLRATELVGRLGSDDMDGVAGAAGAAVARLLAFDPEPAPPAGWLVAASRPAVVNAGT